MKAILPYIFSGAALAHAAEARPRYFGSRPGALVAVKACLAVQIEPDGSQPLELRRTKAFSYSRLNLHALSTLATMADHVGFDL